MLEQGLATANDDLDLALGVAVGRRNARGRSATGEAQLLNGFAELTTVVNINQVKVSAAAKILKRVVSIIGPLGTQRVPLNPFNTTVVDHQKVKVPGESS